MKSTWNWADALGTWNQQALFARVLAATGLVAILASVFVPGGASYHRNCEESFVIDVGGIVYVVIEELLSNRPLEFILYVETNWNLGLQRGGESLLGARDLCQDAATPDLQVFTSSP